jgi:hypothetical protein
LTPVIVLWVRAEDTRELARLIAEKIGNLRRRRLVSLYVQRNWKGGAG